MPVDRRSFLQLLSAGALSASLPERIARALALPANNKTGTLQDVEHIVFMMQENRAVKLHGGSALADAFTDSVTWIITNVGAPPVGVQVDDAHTTDSAIG